MREEIVVDGEFRVRIVDIDTDGQYVILDAEIDIGRGIQSLVGPKKYRVGETMTMTNLRFLVDTGEADHD